MIRLAFAAMAAIAVGACTGPEPPVATTDAIDLSGAHHFREGTERPGATDGVVGDRPDVAFHIDVGEPVIASPVATADTAFVCDGVERLLAVDVADGDVVWSASIGACDSSVVVTADTVFSLASDGTLRSHDRSDGRLRWSTALDGSTRSSPLLVDGVLVAVSGSSLSEVDAGTGTVIDRVEIGRQVGSSPTSFGERVIVGTADNTVVDGSGEVVVDLGDVPEDLVTFTDGIAATPAVLGDVAVVGSTNGLVVAFDEAGDVRWEVDLGTPVYSSAALSAEIAHLGTAGGELVAIDLADGSVRWRTDLGDASYSSPVRVGDTVLATAENGLLWAVEADTGTVRWSVPIGEDGNFMASTPAVAGSRIVVGSNDGSVVGLTTEG